MDSEAEATIARVYCRFQNRKIPIIKPKIIPKKKNNIIKAKDGIVASRPKDYNYIDKYYIPNDKIKLPVIPANCEKYSILHKLKQEKEKEKEEEIASKCFVYLSQDFIDSSIDEDDLKCGGVNDYADSSYDSHDGTRLPCGCFNYYSDEVNSEFNSDCIRCSGFSGRFVIL